MIESLGDVPPRSLEVVFGIRFHSPAIRVFSVKVDQ